MMKKSTSKKVSFFVVFVLVSAIFSVNGNVYAQNESLSEALNVTEVPLDNSTDLTQTTVPVEEELLPTTTTTDGLVTTTNTTSAAPTDEVSGEAHTDDYSGNTTKAGTVTRDSQTILLEGESLPGGSFIHLYDSTPYKIMNGHIAAKVPCTEDNAAEVDVLIGQAPNLAPAQLEFVEPLSAPGDLCLYHVDIASDDVNIVTDIAIANNSTDDFTFPPTSTIVLGVNEISSLGDHGHTE